MPPLVFVSLFILPLLCGCQCHTVQRALKARPSPISPFLTQSGAITPARHRLPFHHVWVTRDPNIQNAIANRTELFIAPVELRYLRDVGKPLMKWEVNNGWVTTRAAEMAHELRQRLALAFARSPRFRLVSAPTSRSIILALAITELTPTSAKGNVAKTAAKLYLGPVAGLMGVVTKGTIAIEGRLLVAGHKTWPPYLEFADREKDKLTVVSLRDFQPYAHAKVAMTDWARQLEEFSRTMGNHRVKESLFVTLKPW